LIEYRPGVSPSNVAVPFVAVFAGGTVTLFSESSSPTIVTVAPGITAPLGSETVTINLLRAAPVWAACDGKTTKSARSEERMVDRTARTTRTSA
jgi:hypothetical protein